MESYTNSVILSICLFLPDVSRSLLWRQHLPGIVRVRFGGRDIEFASPWSTGRTGTKYREIAGFKQISQDSISEFPRGE
jgi:hypothetical protein